jgi:FKBP-type peptidyl-prolyl cis-trans isomerase
MNREMKNLLVVAAAVAVIFSSCGVGGGRVKTDVDSMSYAYGVNVGSHLRMQDSMSHAGLNDKMNINLVAKGMLDAFKGKTDMTLDSSTQILNEYFMTKVPAKREAAEIAYLASVESAGKTKTESGLVYEILEPGDMSVVPTSVDTVIVNYVGRYREGMVYDAAKEGAEFESQDSISMHMARMIEGWKEGVQLLGKGGKIRMWIPSALAYGPQGNQMYGGPIGPYETLVFDLDLLDVKPAAVVDPAADVIAE